MDQKYILYRKALCDTMLLVFSFVPLCFHRRYAGRVYFFSITCLLADEPWLDEKGHPIINLPVKEDRDGTITPQ
jgi:hypothetical protein